MQKRMIQFQFVDARSLRRVKLALTWVTGLALGFLAARSYGDVLEGYVIQAASAPLAFWSALAVHVFPLVISTCAAFFYPPVVYVSTLLRGLCLGLGLGTIAHCYLAAGWMISVLLMFGQITYSPVLLWYFDQILENRVVSTDTWICFAIGILIAVADFGIISPFLRDVINI